MAYKPLSGTSVASVGTTEDAKPSAPRILLTVLGKQAREAMYSLAVEPTVTVTGNLAPLALVQLLPAQARPDLIVALCTPEARCSTYPVLEAALKGRFLVEQVDIPNGDTPAEMTEFLRLLTGSVPMDREVLLTVDVTHGFRHLSFLMHTGLLYLSAVRGVRIEAVYYGLFREGHQPNPFLDLRPLLELPRWVHALEVLHDTGSAQAIADALSDREGESAQAKGISRQLSLLSEAYLSGLPLELGQQANSVCGKLRTIEKLLRTCYHLPLAGELVSRLEETLRPFRSEAIVAGRGWKKQIQLTEGELQRQARFIDQLLSRRSYATAVGLMREWTVSWAVGQVAPCGNHWLDRDACRQRAESLLWALTGVESDPELRAQLTREQIELATFWREITSVRNGYHHHGMRHGEVLSDTGNFGSSLKKAESYWRSVLSTCPDISLRLGGKDNVLVSPLGQQRGVLFSAIHAFRKHAHTEPELVLVVCSKESEGAIDEALGHAKYGGVVKRLLIRDPYAGVGEIPATARAAKASLVGADKVLVNITGGTTLMGLVVNQVAVEARRLGSSVFRFGLVDPRPPELQRQDPYRESKSFWLREGGDADGKTDADD